MIIYIIQAAVVIIKKIYCAQNEKKIPLKTSWWSCHGLFCREGHIGQAVTFLIFVQFAPKLQSRKHYNTALSN